MINRFLWRCNTSCSFKSWNKRLIALRIKKIGFINFNEKIIAEINTMALYKVRTLNKTLYVEEPAPGKTKPPSMVRMS